jgi:hypothetical protein
MAVEKEQLSVIAQDSARRFRARFVYRNFLFCSLACFAVFASPAAHAAKSFSRYLADQCLGETTCIAYVIWGAFVNVIGWILIIATLVFFVVFYFHVFFRRSDWYKAFVIARQAAKIARQNNISIDEARELMQAAARDDAAQIAAYSARVRKEGQE